MINLPNITNLKESNSNKLSLENFSLYFDKIFQEINADNKTCILYSDFISDYYATIDFSSFKYIIPNHIPDKINLCKEYNNKPYYIIPLILKFNDKDSHANVLIIDNINKKIELFEPHGSKFQTSDKSLNFDLNYHIKKLIYIILGEKSTFSFENIQNKCPIGLQSKQVINSKSSHCVAWVLFYIHVKILNLDKSTNDIISYFDTYTPKQSDTTIRQYITLIESQKTTKKKIKKDSYYDLTLNMQEQVNVKKNMKKNINKYFLEMSLNDKLDDIKSVFNKFIIYSKFDFFHNIYFETIQEIFKNNTQNKRLKIN
jgi:hypothetical protein